METNSLIVEQPKIIPPAEFCIPYDTNFIIAGSVTIGLVLGRLNNLVSFLKNGLKFAVKINPDLHKNNNVIYAKMILDTLDNILPGDTEDIKNDTTVDYISKHPEVVAELIASKSSREIKTRLLDISKIDDVAEVFLDEVTK